jgi:hypothetical protein
MCFWHPPYLIEQFLFQESRTPGIHWPGFTLRESKKTIATDNSVIHGTSTYTCNIKSHNMLIVSNQLKENWINEPNMSAVITNWAKIDSQSKSIGKTNVSLNIYIPNKNGKSTNSQTIEYIFKDVLPRAVKEFKEILILLIPMQTIYNQ